MGESKAPSLLQKEKRGSAKSDASKVLFPGIGKITNLIILVHVNDLSNCSNMLVPITFADDANLFIECINIKALFKTVND